MVLHRDPYITTFDLSLLGEEKLFFKVGFSKIHKNQYWGEAERGMTLSGFFNGN